MERDARRIEERHTRAMQRIRDALWEPEATAQASLLAWSGSRLGAMSLDLMAHGFPASQVRLDPLARWLGEPAPGALTRLAVSAWEGLMFGAGLVCGLTRRP